MRRFLTLVLAALALGGCKKDTVRGPDAAQQEAAREPVPVETGAARGEALAVADEDESAPPARADRRGIEPADEPPAPPAKPAEGPAATPVNVRPSVLAGSWYEGDEPSLARTVDGFFGAVETGPLEGYPIALIAPHAGYRFSGATAAHAYAQLKGRSYGRVFLIGPSHRAHFQGISLPGEVTHYETPLGRVPLDTEVVATLAREPLFQFHPTAHDEEHSLEIQLPFLQRVLPGARVIPMLASSMSPEQTRQVAASLRKVIRPGDLVVASSDFTHYGPRFGYLGPPDRPFDAAAAPERLAELLDRAWAAIEKRDVDAFFEYKRATRDTICGFLPIAIVMALLPDDARGHLLRTDTSGNLTGDYGDSVSYLSAAFTGLWPYDEVEGADSLAPEEKESLLKLARGQLDAWVGSGKRLTAGDLGVDVTPRLGAESGAFVTLNIDGHLRGCIGTILPVKPLHQAVLDNAVNAAAFDRRFKPVAPEELRKIKVEVSVLTPPRPVSRWEEIVLARDGVILQKNGRSAVFLPQVAPEQGWTVAETLSHLARKAGLGSDEWREGTEFHVFQAIVFHEAE
jgi:AmmeMemoRadiSam system protein B/AmmeMemoRadiSam system protein A